MKKRYVIAGCGYSGRRLAMRLGRRADVLCVTRSKSSRDRLRADGLDAISDDLGAPVESAGTAGATVIYLAPPPADGNRDTTLEGYLAAIESPARFVYASTSGVYGDCGGELVDETRPPAPGTARAKRRMAAENALGRWAVDNGIETVVLRVAGIYGPGRLPLDRIRRGSPVLRAEDAGPGNRIHVDDLVTVLERAADAPHPPTPVNVCDGNHMSSTKFVELVATMSGMTPPPSIPLEEARRVFTPIRWSFLAESRRLDNTRLREELGVTLRYPDPADGIRNVLENRV